MIEVRLDHAPMLAALRRAAAQMQDTRPLMRAVSGVMLDAVEDNFAQQGRPVWRDLHPGTKLARAKEGTWPGKILQRTGALASSITRTSDGRSATVGTNKVYAAIQFLGGQTRAHVIRPRAGRALSFGGIVVRQVNHPGSTIPARNALRMTPRDLSDILEASQRFYNRAIARNGLASGSGS